MSLRKELIKLAKENPRGIRAYLLPILKEAATEKIWKLLGEMRQTPDGALSIRIGLRSGGGSATLWRKFQMAFTQRKLVVTYDNEGLILTIPSSSGAFGMEEDEFTFMR